MSKPLGHYSILLLVGILVFFTNLGVPPLWDRDEPRNAGCAAEMLARADWVVPVFNGELRTHKPVLLYWLTMAAYSVFGVNEFGARCASAMLALGTVLLSYHIGSRLFDRRVGCWAGVILASTLMFGVAARAATPDSVLIFCGTLALSIFVHGAFPHHGENARPQFPQSYLHVVGMYAAMGLGMLAKGPVGLVLPTAVIGMYLLIANLPSDGERGVWWSRWMLMLRPFSPLHFLRTCWQMRPCTALAVSLAVAAPWYIWVTLRTDGAWTRGFFLEHNLNRALEPMEGHAGPPLFFYVGAILVGFFPWSILAIPTACQAVAGVRNQGPSRQYQAIVFLLCWAGVYVGLFSLAQTKLPSYVTPCYPALAVLVAYCVDRWTAGDVRRAWLRVGLVCFLLVGVGLSVGLPVAAAHFMPGTEWLGVVGLVPIIGGAMCWWCLERSQHRHAAYHLAGTSVVFCLLVLAVLPAEVGRRQRYGDLLRAMQQNSGPIAAYGNLEPSWIFYGRRPIRYFAESETEELMDFVSQHADTALISTTARLSDLQGQVGHEFDVLVTAPYFLRRKQLVLVNPSMELLAEGIGQRSGQAVSR